MNVMFRKPKIIKESNDMERNEMIVIPPAIELLIKNYCYYAL